jgi:hypothetical protein
MTLYLSKQKLTRHELHLSRAPFHIFLPAFRKCYGCQTTLLKVIEYWKQALDENKYVAAILMNLSKAFDDLLLLKLKSYGLWKKNMEM